MYTVLDQTVVVENKHLAHVLSFVGFKYQTQLQSPALSPRRTYYVFQHSQDLQEVLDCLLKTRSKLTPHSQGFPLASSDEHR